MTKLRGGRRSADSFVVHQRCGDRTDVTDRYLFWDLYAKMAARHGDWQIVGAIANHHGKWDLGG